MCNFHDPNLVTFYFYELTHFLDWIEEHLTFHLQYKHSGTFANRKIQNVWPHSSNSIGYLPNGVI